MRTTTALKAGAQYGGPMVFGAGTTMLVAALVASSHYRPDAAGPSPAATVTVTQAPAPVAAPSPRRTPAPSPSMSGPTPAASVQSVSDRQTAMPHTSDGGQSRAEGRPSSTPSSSAAPCGGRVLSVRALSDRACLSIGGSR